MEEELERFGREPALLAAAVATRRTDRMGDLIEQRIGQVRRATERLRDARRFVIDTLNGIPEGALVADTGLRVVLANTQAADLLNLAGGAAEGRGLPELLASVAPATLAPWETLIERAPLSFEAPQPSGRDLLVNIVPFEGAAGGRRGLLVSLVDVSTLKQAERAREETLRFVSHDLRSPLASIMALLDLEELAPDAPPKDMHPRIRRYVERCLSLSDDFVHLGRVDALSAAQFAPLDLVEALRNALQDAETLAAKKSIALAFGEAPAHASVAGVRDLLERVFANLLSNAVKYSPEATRISCSIRREGGHWAVRIADQGQGIAPAALPQLFGRYERLGADRKRGGPGGVGLGLVFVKTTVEKHGGSIDVQSELGRGTCFVLRFPAVDPAAA
jgi:signal transduction histidine kinase